MSDELLASLFAEWFMSLELELDDSFDLREEPVNTMTHGAGFVLSVIGAIVMGLTFRFASFGQALAAWVFVVSMMIVYAASTLSHAYQRPDLRHRFRCWDQGCIFLLIAGTYTPYAVAYLPSENWGPFLLGVWGTALFGFSTKVFWAHQVEAVSTTLYLLLGWVPALAFQPVCGQIPTLVLGWTILAGLAYTIGTIFLHLDRRVAYFHTVWHLLVILGSFGHYMAIGAALGRTA